MNWQSVTLASVCKSVRYGYTASATEEQIGPKFLRITDIVPECLDWDSVPYCKASEKDERRFSLEVGDIVVARTGATVGFAKQIRDVQNAVFASYLVRFKVDCELADPYFVGCLVESKIYKRYVKSQIGGAAQPNANAKVLGSFRFKLPSRTIQRRVASIASAYDDLIENNRRRIALLEEAARLLYREWFVHFRFPGHEYVKTTDGLPEDWRQLSLGEIANVRKGKNITKATVEEGDIPVVAGGLGPAYWHNTANVVGPVVTVSASGANAGHVALYHTDIWASDCSYLSSAENTEIWFLYLSLKSRQRQITNMQQGAAQPHVYPKDLERLPMVVPPVSLRNLFQKRVDASFRQIAVLQGQNQKLAQARDLLLPRLLSGEIAV